ncbi:hypothetical protein SARC_06553 [Sphaeroforma arctica JP610]|uniref:Beta-adaptin appendage C-terminal subdomain domain-containing protein n=1 Tax=Sphaeroforma arctica JP610 TaxID=667725 RepID=A0A0L0FWV7_9EUKA|nr:hypothetical protein SARC_06553 [Sphaeroforma arctica JP610]KNC81104.1 hypothetical protein SARC_06553 [Sphaeroforma arctica JP610]|eukprot:XP_014155006.1 hypothetical protein SARC_06553 [Sphaeroforma arctica JP610]
MTVGKDVSALFPDVVNCMQTDNLELKKLVYLYLMNYATSQPDLTIMAVNTFQKDCHDPSPLIRALAVRTMGCIRVDKITEYLCDPLRKCLKDEDPYVRKTAAVCVAKLYDINPELVEDQGFLETLRDMLSDPTPMVVANAVAALSEINEVSEDDVMVSLINSGTLNKLLTAINECTEWGQIFILDSLSAIEPKDSKEAQHICERVLPRLQHANTAVVLSAVKVIMKYLEFVEDSNFEKAMERKLAPPLVTMMSVEPEVQYIALRNINLVVQRRPNILKHEMKVFFVKYNDPIYVKLEKLDIVCRLASEANISQVLAELKEYATEVDVDFVRRSVRAIGRCAIKIEGSAERCIDTLVNLIHTKVNYVVQEAIVVIKDIFRKYPNRYESIIGRLCENLDTLDEPEAKASMIWIIGEYAGRIDNADEILEQFLDNYLDEGPTVQLQILTAIVKLFLKKPQDNRIPGARLQAPRSPPMERGRDHDSGDDYGDSRSPSPQRSRSGNNGAGASAAPQVDLMGDLLGLDMGPSEPVADPLSGMGGASSMAAAQGGGMDDFDLLGGLGGMDMGGVPAAAQPSGAMGGLDDLLGGLGDPAPVQSGAAVGQSAMPLAQATGYTPQQFCMLTAQKGKGLEVYGTFSRRGRQPAIELSFTNKAMKPMQDFAIQFNKNTFGIAPETPLNMPGALMPNQTREATVPLTTIGPVAKSDPITQLQIALKNNVDVFYYNCNMPVHVVFVEDGVGNADTFFDEWDALPRSNRQEIEDVKGGFGEIQDKLSSNNIFTVSDREDGPFDVLSCTMKLSTGVWVYAEVAVGRDIVEVDVKSQSAEIIPFASDIIRDILLA